MSVAMRLRYDEADEAFRRELLEWLEAHAPSRELLGAPKLSSAFLPQWARDWQRTLFDAGWLVPGWPPENIEELAKRFEDHY